MRVNHTVSHWYQECSRPPGSPPGCSVASSAITRWATCATTQTASAAVTARRHPEAGDGSGAITQPLWAGPGRLSTRPKARQAAVPIPTQHLTWGAPDRHAKCATLPQDARALSVRPHGSGREGPTTGLGITPGRPVWLTVR